jgi:hypothetical protein
MAEFYWLQEARPAGYGWPQGYSDVFNSGCFGVWQSISRYHVAKSPPLSILLGMSRCSEGDYWLATNPSSLESLPHPPTVLGRRRRSWTTNTRRIAGPWRLVVDNTQGLIRRNAIIAEHYEVNCLYTKSRLGSFRLGETFPVGLRLVHRPTGHHLKLWLPQGHRPRRHLGTYWTATMLREVMTALSITVAFPQI